MATTASATPTGADAESDRPTIGPLPVGVVVWLSSELMFFAGLFASYFTLAAANDTWPPAGVELEVVRAGIFTVVLIVSSFTMHAAVLATEKNRHERAVLWLTVTMALGLMFVANQFLEFRGLGFGIGTDAYGTIFWTLTGFHWLHVIGGIGLMLALLRLTFRGTRAPVTEHYRVSSYYWHFVDVVWIGVFAAVYLGS